MVTRDTRKNPNAPSKGSDPRSASDYSWGCYISRPHINTVVALSLIETMFWWHRQWYHKCPRLINNITKVSPQHTTYPTLRIHIKTAWHPYNDRHAPIPSIVSMTDHSHIKCKISLILRPYCITVRTALRSYCDPTLATVEFISRLHCSYQNGITKLSQRMPPLNCDKHQANDIVIFTNH